MPSISVGILPDLERLEQALDKPGPLDRVALGFALSRMEETLSEHERDIDQPEGLLDEGAEVARPSLARRADKLRQNAADLLAQAHRLHLRAWDASDDGAEGDEFLRDRSRRLLGGLRRLHDGEANLLWESLNTDIGAGD